MSRKVTRTRILDAADQETARVLAAYLVAGCNAVAAGAALGMDRRTVKKHVDRAGFRGLGGTAPAPMPPGRNIERMTEESFRDPKTGKWIPTRTWVKSKEARPGDLDPDAFADILRAALDDLERAPLPPAQVAPTDPDAAARLVLFPWADLHLGRKSWGRQTGTDWDLSIAAAAYRAAAAEVLRLAPDGAEAVLLGLGDLTEADDDTDATPAHGHKLDVDTRHEKTAEAALGLILWKVAALRAKYARVRVVILPGNHDERTARMIRVALRFLYDGDAAVIVEDLPSVFWFYRWGDCYLAAHHGHKIKNAAAMAGRMATDRPDLWGASRFRHAHMGHLHHEWAKEEWATRVEGHASPAARSRYDAESPWASGRLLQAITYDATRGHCGRVVVNLPDTLERTP